MKKSIFNVIILSILLISFIILTGPKPMKAEEFSSNNQVTNFPTGEYSPSIVVSDDGKIYAIWTDDRNSPSPPFDMDYDVFIANSTDGGNSFGQESKINDDTTNAHQWATSITVDTTGMVHVVWDDWRNDADYKWEPSGGIDGLNDGDIYYANSIGGSTFSINKMINDDSENAYQYGSSMAIDSIGNTHIVWVDNRSGGWDNIYYANSSDGGTTFSVNKPIDSFPTSQRQPSIAIDENDNIHVVWVDQRESGFGDIYYSNSTDGGISFSPGKRITDDLAPNDVQDTPSIAVGGGFIGVAWKDSREELIGDIYFTNSTDGGISFGPNTKVNDDTGSAFQELPSIVVNNIGYIAITWQDERNGDTDIYFTSSNDGGAIFGDGISNNNDIKVNDDLTNQNQVQPSLTIDKNGYIYVAWCDARSGTSLDIYFSRSPPELTDLEISSTDIVFNPLSPVQNGNTVTINSTIHNLGDRNASDVVVKLFDGVPSLGDQIGSDQTISFIEYLGGIGYVQVPWTAEPTGMHDICVVVDPDNNVTESNEMNNIACSTIIVLEYDYIPVNITPPNISIIGLGKQALISAQVKNQGDSNPGIDSTLAFYNESGMPFKTDIVSPLGPSGTSSTYTATWTSPTTPGIYNVTVGVDHGNIIPESNETNNNYTIQFDVREGPITSIQIGLPQYGSLPIYITSVTSISFSVGDNSGEGIKSTYYKLNATGSWINYTSTGSFTIPAEGEYEIYFNSTDNLGNTENTNIFTVRVDNTPTKTSVTIDEPKYRGDGNAYWNVTTSTTIALSSIDGGITPVGTQLIEYWIDSPSDWMTYVDQFNLGGLEDGLHTICYKGSDFLSNTEEEKTLILNLDTTPPVTTINPEEQQVEMGTTFTLVSTDSGSGVDYIQYSIDDDDWTNYSIPFTIESHGQHNIRFRSTDKLGNTEVEITLSIEIPEPQEFNWKPIIAMIFTTILLIFGTMVSLKRPLKSVKNAKNRKNYTWMIAVLPFIVAEIATGAISGLTGLLSVPPFLGPGMVVDLAILIMGLLVFVLIYKRLGEK